FYTSYRYPQYLNTVCARHRPTDDDSVVFRNDVVNRCPSIRDSGVEHLEPQLLPFPAGRQSWSRGVVDVIFGRDLVDHAEVPTVQNLIVEHSHGRFVLLFSHVFLLLSSPYLRPQAPPSI